MESKTSAFVYPGTNVLINKPGIRNQDELTRFENIVTTARNARLYLQPIHGHFDLDHLRKIHKYLFQDVYPFAGRIRTDNIAKGTFSFASCQYIEPSAKDLFKHLKNENYLVSTDCHTFSERAAHYMAEVNVLHPFREGNGRTQREFIRCLALNAGYELNWDHVPPKVAFQASVQSVVDTGPLKDVILNALINRIPEKKFTQLFHEQASDRER
ncbi:Fic/DOC family protein [Paenibacillus lutrae]|uniref:protein adenylyltransferase n=1 Tax=Paenibacillus lutrae TaxID=2078573 RepID=A0A7X3FLU9_9BACL|nr:Fic family protein [Paenibacillus lutrae]MVP02144.1 cell filamentation protein Fic [Paenibacillus lutrae]